MAKSRLHIANGIPKLLWIDNSNHMEDLRLKNHIEQSGKITNIGHSKIFTGHAKHSVHKSRRIII